GRSDSHRRSPCGQEHDRRPCPAGAYSRPQMKPADYCPHTDLDCLNQFELVRKYRCRGCNAVMMCACDETRGRRFLPHQLDEGTELGTQARVSVTAGFQPKVCPECRGLPPVNAPVAAIYGR